MAVLEAALDLVADDRPGTLDDDLAPGSVEGSDPAGDGETVSGQLAVTGGVGTVTYEVTGGGSTAAGPYGQLQINADGSNLKLTNVKPSVIAILEMLRLHKVFEVELADAASLAR